MLNLHSNFLSVSTLIGSMLGGNKKWDCCLQYSQGFNFSWPTGNGYELQIPIGFIGKDGLLISIVVWDWSGIAIGAVFEPAVCFIREGFVLCLEGWWNNSFFWGLWQAGQDVAAYFWWTTNDGCHARCTCERSCLDTGDESFSYWKLGQDPEVCILIIFLHLEIKRVSRRMACFTKFVWKNNWYCQVRWTKHALREALDWVSWGDSSLYFRLARD